jgi:hypothetical protein
MYLEFVALTGIIILALIVIIEITKMSGLGLIAGVLFLFLAYWIYGSGIQVNLPNDQTTITNSYLNTTTNITVSTETKTPNYTALPVTPFVDITNLLAFCSLLCGLYSIIHYSIDLTDTTK